MLIEPSTLTLLGAALIGLVVGSFLNVVIHRLPLMMQARWRTECREHLGLTDRSNNPEFSLISPASRCPHCKAAIKPWQNIPVVSYLLLRGKCGSCGEKISFRYPLVELLSALLTTAVIWHFGLTAAGISATFLVWALITLTFIDLDHHLLPDSITLPVMWLGLLLNTASVYTDPVSAIFGAIFGYLSLWSVFHLFRLLTGKEGMGYGDFKLLAVLGAWLGWQLLPQIVVIASFAGAAIGIVMLTLRAQERETPIPFGPYLAIAGVIALFWGDLINHWYMQISGITSL
jgi:leader peptidase (prepilin peptidase)/N-methyltransferase